VEALLAFFLESTFLGIWIFGWERLSKKAHVVCIWLVAVASNLSALWILIANSFMQNPVGYELINGRAQMVDFPALLTNSHVLFQFPHVLAGGLTTGAFFLMGISAIHLIKNKDNPIFRSSFKLGGIVGIIAVLLTLGIGHLQGQALVQDQPMKMAAAEAHWETADPADLALVAIVDRENQRNSFEIKLPRMLSLLSYNSLSGEVKGLKQLQAEMEAKYGPGDYIPPVTVTFWSFRLMFGVGCLMALLAIIAAILRTSVFEKKGFLKIMSFAIILPYIANTFGWWLAEFGRQPWIVYGLQTLDEGISSTVPTPYIAITLVGFILIYGILMILDIFLLSKYAKKTPEEIALMDGKEVSLWT
jgi:cytochrome d ubiquinol oxidase subunit I